MNNGVFLKWNLSEELSCKEFNLYRAKNSDNLKPYASLNYNKKIFYDSSAVFGLYKYKVECVTNSAKIRSNSIETQFYFGTSITDLYPNKAVEAGHHFNIVLGNASKNEKVHYVLYNKNGDIIYSKEKRLDNQLFILLTETLTPNTYLAFIKLKDFDVFTYKFSIQ